MTGVQDIGCVWLSTKQGQTSFSQLNPISSTKQDHNVEGDVDD